MTSPSGDGLPDEPRFGPAEELQTDPDPPRRGPLWLALILLAVVAAVVLL